jgi:hypothetical protein
MLGIFTAAKADHPLADDTQRQHVFEQLAAAPPVAALGRIAELLSGLRAAADLPLAARGALIRQCDDAAQAHLRVVGREYLTMAALDPAEELRLWRAAREFWAQLGAGYSACLNEMMQNPPRPELARGEIARFVVRLMRAYGGRQKWDQFRYWPASDALWQIVGRGYLYAEQAGAARWEITAYPGERQATTVDREYLRLLVFRISAMDSLLPFEVEIAEQLIGMLAGDFVLSAQAGAAFPFYVQPDERRAPSRVLGKVEDDAATRYIGLGVPLATLVALERALMRGDLPEELAGLRYRSPRVVMPVLRHLTGHWVAVPRERAHSRHKVSARLTVVEGLTAAWGMVARSPGAADAVEAHWSAENVSMGGVHARAPITADAPVRIGTLVAIRPEGGENWLVGAVRRVTRDADNRAGIGIETLSRQPLALEVLAPQPGQALLLDAPDEGEPVRIVLPGAGFREGEAIEAALVGRPVRFEPIDVLERGVEFEVARYRVAGG